jgi:hypothetical protein
MRVNDECLSCKWYGIDCTDCEPMHETSDKCSRYEPQEEEPYPVQPEDCQ